MKQRLDITTKVASRTASLLHLGSGLAAEVVEVVERMHGTIEQLPLPTRKLEDDRTRGITGIVYRGIRRCFHLVTEALGSSARGLTQLAGEDDSPKWVMARGIINGVCGDALEARANPLAQAMRLVNRQGDADAQTMVVFIHGLCMTEHGWQRGAFAEFEAWARDVLGAQTAHLRYNSGRRISVNGRELSGLLEALVRREKLTRLVLIGHSMGGLLARSACHYGKDLLWASKLTHLAMLGTPHQGAPLERLGNFANGLLKKTSYTTPLAHLGDLRSAGIKDLRFCNLLDEHWVTVPHDAPSPANKEEVVWLTHVDYLLLGATRSPRAGQPVTQSKDDLLVPVQSALLLSRTGEELLPGLSLRRQLLEEVDHMALMAVAETYAHLRAFLQETA